MRFTRLGILLALIMIVLVFSCACSRVEKKAVLEKAPVTSTSDQEWPESGAESKDRTDVPDSKEPDLKPVDEQRDSEEKGSVLFLASDYQHRDGWGNPPDTLSSVLDAVYEAGIAPNNAILCGDYTTEHGHNNYNANPHIAIQEIKKIFLDHDPDWNTDEMIFVQGNHDERTEDISDSGLHEYEDYLVYVLNTEVDFPWRQGKNKQERKTMEGALRLQKCLDDLRREGEERPIFLAAHVPLHFSGRTSSLQGTGDNLYARYLFNVINEEAEELNLVYLYGHNHSRGWDSYLGGSCVFREPGNWILVPDPAEGEHVTSSYTQETIRFTYLNAGYVGYFSSAGGEAALTGTICEVWGDHLVFSRYAKDGLHILSAVGTPNPAKDDRQLIPEEYYGTELESKHAVWFHGAGNSGEQSAQSQYERWMVRQRDRRAG